MTSSRSHRGGIRRLTLVAWVGVLLVLALTLFATFSSASPIHESKQRHAVKSSTADLQILPHEQPHSPSSMPEGVNNGDKSKQLQSLATNSNDLDGKVQLLASGSPLNDIASAVDTSTITTGSEEENVLVRAQNEASDYFNENFNRINVPLTWQRCIGGGILMAIGLYMTLFGFRFPRFTLLLTGFIGGVIACYAILVNVEPAEKWANRVLVYCAVCIAGGLLIGLVLIALNRWALWLLGGAGGLALGVFILSWRNGTLLHNGAARVGMMVGCAGLGALLGLVLGKYIIVFATVLIGGYMFTLGLDMFLRTGFIENYRNMFRHTDAVNYTLNGGIYGMLGVVSLMYLLGALIQLPLFIRHWRNKRRLARAAAASRSGGYGAAPYSRGSQYGGSQYGGSQYGNSRDNLLGPNSGAGTGEKREYNWWGKRVNKNPAPGAAPAGMHGPNQSYYSEKSGSRNVATTQASHVNPATTAATTTAGGDKAVVFEEKKDWLGRSKVVPKVVAAGAVGAAGAKAASTVPEASTSTSVQQGSALPTVVYKEKKNWRGSTKMVSVVDKKPKTLYEVPKASKTGKAVAKNAAGVEYSTVSGPGGHVGTYNVNAAVSKPTRRRESTDLLEDTIRHPEVPLSAAYQTKSSLWGSLFGKKSKPEKKTEEKPKVTFSEVQGPVTTTTGDNSNNYNNNNNGGNHGSRGIEQQQQTQVDNQNMTLQPQMQPNNAYNYNTGAYNPYGYYPPGPAQESYILVGVDNQGSAPRENVMPQSQVAVQPTSTYTAQGPAPVTVPMDTSMPSTSGPTDTMVTTTPNVSETQGATGETGTTPAATTKGSKKLMGTSMSKLFGRRSGEHSDPIKDSNTDGLTPATTATVTAV